MDLLSNVGVAGYPNLLLFDTRIISAAELNLQNTCYVPGVGRMSKKAYAILMEKRRQEEAGQKNGTKRTLASKPKRGRKGIVEGSSTAEAPASKPKQGQKRSVEDSGTEETPASMQTRGRTRKAGQKRKASRSKAGSRSKTRSKSRSRITHAKVAATSKTTSAKRRRGPGH